MPPMIARVLTGCEMVNVDALDISDENENGQEVG